MSAIRAAHLPAICTNGAVGNDISGPTFRANQQHGLVIDTSDSPMQAYLAIMLWTERVLSPSTGILPCNKPLRSRNEYAMRLCDAKRCRIR